MSAELAAFQALLLEVLARESDPGRALAELRAHPDAAPFRDWLDRLEPRMVKVAQELGRTWGRRG